MLRIDRDAAIRRFDELWMLVNGDEPRDDSGRPINAVLDVAVFMDLNGPQASFIADMYGADALYSVMEIRQGKFKLRPEYKHYAVKGAERRQAAAAWKRWYKEQTSPPKVKKPRAPRKKKGGAA